MPLCASCYTVLLYIPRCCTVRLKVVSLFFVFVMYYLYEKYYKPIAVQYYKANCVNWVPRLTSLDLRTNWTYNHALWMELVHRWGLTVLKLQAPLWPELILFPFFRWDDRCKEDRRFAHDHTGHQWQKEKEISRSAMSDSLRPPHGPQHARLPCQWQTWDLIQVWLEGQWSCWIGNPSRCYAQSDNLLD